jgi:hypothetical protein
LRFGLIAGDRVKFRRCFAGCIFARLLSASLNGANENAIGSRTGTVDGVKLYYLTAGHEEIAEIEGRNTHELELVTAE